MGLNINYSNEFNDNIMVYNFIIEIGYWNIEFFKKVVLKEIINDIKEIFLFINMILDKLLCGYLNNGKYI